jgi:nucleotide-binding universal stress UspA family protein
VTFRTLLVHIDNHASCRPRLDAAIRLAIEHGAELVGLYLVPGTDMTPSAAAMLRSEVVERRLGEFAEMQHAAENNFRAIASAAGLTSVDWRAPAGPPIDAAVAHGRCTDLFILGQHNPAATNFSETLASTVLLSSGRPTLVIPYVSTPATLGENVLVAWDGGREASRAIGDALPLLERAKRVEVMVVDADPEAKLDDRLASARVAAWLQCHGITVEVARQEVQDVRIGEWLLSRAADLGSDLIVMGGYGHARMRELVLGGVTRTMLRAMTVPVFIAH